MTRRGSGVQIPHGPQNEQKNSSDRCGNNSYYDDRCVSYSAIAIGHALSEQIYN